jgi:mRNA interferase MazF
VTIAQRDDLEQTCQVMTEQPRTLDRQRLIEGPLTRATADEMQRIERSFRAVVGMFD